MRVVGLGAIVEADCDGASWCGGTLWCSILEERQLYIAFQSSHLGFWKARSAKGTAMAFRHQSVMSRG